RHFDLTSLERALPAFHSSEHRVFAHRSIRVITMILFGSMYYIVPRLVGREWRYATLIKLHFWASAYGIGLMSLMLLIGGLAQGASQNDPALPFSESIESVLP